MSTAERTLKHSVSMLFSLCVLQVTASAVAAPADGPQQSNPPTTQSIINLEIGGCQSIQAADTVSVTVEQPVSSSNTSYVWKGSGSPVKPLTKIQYDQTAELKYNLTWSLVQEVTSSLSGVVTINNPTESAVTVQNVYVAPEITNANRMDGVIPVAQATCANTTVSPGSDIQCTYNSVFRGSGSGDIAAQALTISSTGVNRTVQSDTTSFNISQQATAAAAAQQQESCAEVITGLTMGSALLVPGAAGAIKYSLNRVCQSGGTVITQPVGPFPDTACGKYTVGSGLADGASPSCSIVVV